MARSASELEALAGELFSGQLADEVKAHIRQADALRTLAPPRPGEFRPESIATGRFGDALYESLGVGAFTGRPVVEWNGFDHENDRPTFIFRPDPARPFRYVTSKGRVIEPRIMDTDGGTIPLALHGLSKFAPWGYAPAYIIHDWLFVAHKCNLAPDNDVTFEEQASLLAEAIKTLVVEGYQTVDGERRHFQKAEDTLYLIYLAVGSRIARGMWDNLSNVVCRT